jgi:hypothetical protein
MRLLPSALQSNLLTTNPQTQMRGYKMRLPHRGSAAVGRETRERDMPRPRPAAEVARGKGMRQRMVVGEGRGRQ